MNETLPPPSPSAAAASAPTSVDRRLQDPVALFLVAAVIGVVIGGLVGAATGFVVGAGVNADCSPQDGWCELGGLIAGVLIGGVIGIAAYLTAGVITIRRHRPAGARSGHIIAHTLALVAVPTALILLGTLLPV